MLLSGDPPKHPKDPGTKPEDGIRVVLHQPYGSGDPRYSLREFGDDRNGYSHPHTLHHTVIPRARHSRHPRMLLSGDPPKHPEDPGTKPEYGMRVVFH